MTTEKERRNSSSANCSSCVAKLCLCPASDVEEQRPSAASMSHLSKDEKEQAVQRKRLEALLKLPGNVTCADCPSRCACPKA